MDTGPAPQSALRISQRFAVSTFQSNSGDAKLIRADLCCLFVFHASAKLDMASRGDRTSRITVFTIPPLDIALEIGQ